MSRPFSSESLAVIGDGARRMVERTRAHHDDLNELVQTAEGVVHPTRFGNPERSPTPATARSRRRSSAGSSLSCQNRRRRTPSSPQVGTPPVRSDPPHRVLDRPDVAAAIGNVTRNDAR